MPAMTLPPTTLAVSSERSPATVVDEVARGLVEDAEVASASLWLLAPDAGCAGCGPAPDRLHLVATADRSPPRAPRCAPLAVDSELGRLTGALALDDRVRGGEPGTLRALLAAEQARLPDVTGAIAQALVAHGVPLGLLVVFVREPIEDECLRCVRDYADLSAVSISNARAFEEVRRLQGSLSAQRDRLQLLLDVNAAVVRHLELPALLDAIATSLGRFVRHEYASLALREEGIDGLRLHALSGVGKDIGIHGSVSSFEGSPAGVASLTGRPQLAHTEAELRAFGNPRLDKVVEAGVKCMASAPLLVSGKAIGSVTAGSVRERAFGPADLELLLQVANQLAPAVSNALAFLEIGRLKDKLAREKSYLEGELHHDFREIVGTSPGLAKVLDDVQTVAPTDSTVLIWGETGTGKELIARAIHEASGRKKGTFVKLNCAAIPTGLLESELFGHERGAFTGALERRVGRFELADGGTLFLDEVGDIPAELQPKLLRVLQEQEFERLGGNKTIKVDVRLVAATNRDLAEMVADREFRSDLYYRLNVFPITLPALRERPGDVALLVRHFVDKCARKLKKRLDVIPPATLAALEGYAWPGNVRELENVVERSVILSRGNELVVPPGALGSVPHAAAPPSPSPVAATPAGATLEEAERTHILAALHETKWVLGGPAGAAARLGMNRTTLQSKMKRLGIERPA